MSRSTYVEEVHVVAQAEPDVPRFERVAVLLGIGALSAVLAVGLVLYLVKFQVDRRIVEWSLVSVGFSAVVVFFRIKPASSLTPVERMVRARRQVYFLLGLLTGAATLGSIATAAELDSAGDWAMLLFIASSPLGIGVMLNTRFSLS